jgi:hypothetical protein
MKTQFILSKIENDFGFGFYETERSKLRLILLEVQRDSFEQCAQIAAGIPSIQKESLIRRTERIIEAIRTASKRLE